MGVEGFEQVKWRGGTKLAPFAANNADRMAKAAIEQAVRDAGYTAIIRNDGPHRRVLGIAERVLHNGARRVLVEFFYEPKRGGVVATRIRRLVGEGVAPAQWSGHMPDVLRLESAVRWSDGRSA